jgi:membrane protease YdiL (CAAX protease family)
MVIGDAYILGWLRLRSNSLWPCAMLHATHNLFIQGIFDRSTAQSGRALYITTEFGFGMVITTAITAFILWRNAIPEQDASLLAPASVEA